MIFFILTHFRIPILLLLCSALCANPEKRVPSSDPKLTGIIFYGSKRALNAQKLCESIDKDIGIVELSIPVKWNFCKKIKRFFDREISNRLLQDVRKETTQYFKKHGYPLVTVMIPEDQDITNGVVKVLVVKAKLGKIDVKGAKYRKDKKVLEKIQARSHKEIDYYQLLSDLSWVNRDPYIDAHIILQPGDVFGYTNLVINVEDRFPCSAYVGYENTGNLIGGNTRYFAGFDFGNLLNSENLFRYQFITSSSTSRWYAHTGNVILRTPWKNILDLYGAYNQAMGINDEIINGSGKAWKVTGNYIIPINFSFMESDLFFGYEFKRTDNFLNFGDTFLFDDFFDISQFKVGYEGMISSIGAMRTFGIHLYYSPGKMTKYNRSGIFEEQRLGAKANYVYIVGHFGQSLKTNKGFYWIFDMKMQVSSAKLLPLEEFSLGGMYTVRGYDENEVVGDIGLLLKNELRAPPIIIGFRKELSLQPLLFVDFGAIWEADQSIIRQNSTVLGSIGPGVRIQISEKLVGRIDYGLQLHEIDREVGESDKRSRFHISASINWKF